MPSIDQPISFAGSDILCLISLRGDSPNQIVEIEDRLQTITVTSARSVMPIRRIGETNPIEYARGSRTIAGSMVFTTGLRDAFVEYFADKSVKDGEPMREPTLFVDQIAKFDMIFEGHNEVQGVIAHAILIGITLTNFGTTLSIDDIYTESTFTYVAEQYFPLSVEKGSLSNKQNRGGNSAAIARHRARNAPEQSVDHDLYI
jgi:hypothetical protein